MRLPSGIADEHRHGQDFAGRRGRSLQSPRSHSGAVEIVDDL